jgi:hypothetical protein
VSNIVDVSEDGGQGERDRDIDKKKFLLALERYGNWPDCTRVCRPILETLIKATPDSDFDQVRRFVADLPPWPDQHQGPTIAVAKIDPQFSDLAVVWPKEENGDCRPVRLNEKNVRPASLQHHCLLYDSRNKLSHELRELVSEGEASLGHIQAYYHRTEDWNGEYWQVYQPPGFFVKMAKDILVGLRDYCLESKVEPFQRLFPGRYWYERPY